MCDSNDLCKACTIYGPRQLSIWPEKPKIICIRVVFLWKHNKNRKTHNQSGPINSIYTFRSSKVVHP